MKKNIKKCITFILALVTVFTVIILVPEDTSALITDADIKALEQKIKDNSDKIKAYESKIKQLQNNISSTNALKKELDEQIKVMQDNIDDTKQLIARYEELIAQKTDEINTKETEYNLKYSSFLEMMRVYYEDNTTNYLDMILGSNSLSEFLTQFERVGSLLTFEQTLMRELNVETVDLKNMKNDISLKREEAEELKKKLEDDEALLQEKLSETEALIKKYMQDQNIAAKTLAEVQKLDEEFDAQLTKLLKQYEEQKRTQYVGGDLLWPVDPELNYVSSKFGWRTLYGKPNYHRGIDIIRLGYNIYGANIYAANDGTVVTATNHYSYGNYILINHGGGYATLYAHCSKLLVKSGDEVKRGQVIGLIGSTGNSTGNHLHFEVRINGVVQDPLSGYLSHPSNLIVAK